MNIDGMVHCFFEQSGTFKNEFIKLGIHSEDYDIRNSFGETDHVIDLFSEIESAYNGEPSIFDNISKDDLILAFFPCIQFCDAKVMTFRAVSIFQKNWTWEQIMRKNISFAREREQYFTTLLKLVAVSSHFNLRLIIENPWNTSRMTYLQNNFPHPSLIDSNRARRGDYYVKPTAYWYFQCTPTYGYTEQINPNPKIVYKQSADNTTTGVCDEQRSLISPDYARNFICDNILGKTQHIGQLNLFDL